MFTLRNIVPDKFSCCGEVKKAQLADDITEDDFDLGYVLLPTVVNIRNKAGWWSNTEEKKHCGYCISENNTAHLTNGIISLTCHSSRFLHPSSLSPAKMINNRSKFYKQLSELKNVNQAGNR